MELTDRRGFPLWAAFRFLFILAAAASFILPARHLAASETIELLQQAEQSQKKKIGRLEKGITSQKEKLAQNKEQELLLYNELKKIDVKLLAEQKAILKSQERLMRQEGFLESKEIEFDLIREDKQKTEVHIKNRLRSFYQMGEIGIINTIFSASTLPELLNTKEYFHHLFQYDRQTIQRYKNKLVLLEGARKEMLDGKETLLSTIIETKNQEKDLIAVRQERAKLLKQIQTEESLYKQALAEMQRSAADLAETFNQYKKKITLTTENKKKKAPSQDSKTPSDNTLNDFPSQKGKLPPPVDQGSIITYYGKSKGVFGVEINSNGIDIQINNDDAKVKAVHKGVIVFAGELAGYGNVVIIDHGWQYFTLASRMNKINTQKGNKVKRGETIGTIEKEQSGLLQKGLHFEVRSGSTPEDPLPWLDKSLISLVR